MDESVKNSRVDIEKLNDWIENDTVELINFAEQNYFDQIRHVAKIVASNQKASILLLAGPSASSKTTTSYKLLEELDRNGIHAVVISLDDFYIDRELLPLLEDGSTDFESIATLDLERLSECFGELLRDKKSQFPLFDFGTGCRTDKTREVAINDNSVLIIEGLHALNPRIIKGYSPENFMKLYICPTSDYYIGDEIILTARDIRLVRRVIRDYFHRSSTIHNTLQMWVNVIIAEVSSIMPFKEQADIVIDSTVIYEPNVYVDYLLELIDSADGGEGFIGEISRIKMAMEKFQSLSISYVPCDTVLREFLE